MLEQVTIKRYISGYLASNEGENESWWFAFTGNKLLVKRLGDSIEIPSSADFDGVSVSFENKHYIGKFDSHDCWSMECDYKSLDFLEPLEVRSIARLTGDNELFLLAGTAYQILHWNRINKFCGKCGGTMTEKPDERAKLCPVCGNVVYPRISPATITAVLKGDEILLAHNVNFPENLYSLVAGFVEPGETLEECARREILEEVGVSVKNITYFSSQPWPFPDSLMIAFVAEYEGGDITVDNIEISHAEWFKAEGLPLIPSTESVAGKLIRWFMSKNSN